MGNIRNNKLSTLNNKGYSSNEQNLKSFKRKVYENRKPLSIQKYFRQIEQNQSIPDNYVGVSQTNVIPCPECKDIVDITEAIENKQEHIQCPRCGLRDIDLILELKRNNKLELLESAGFPSARLISRSKPNVQDLIVRPKLLSKTHTRDSETGIKTRVMNPNSPTTINQSQSKRKHINKDFMDEYNNYMNHEDQIANKPIKSLVDKANVQITGIWDVKV